MHTIQPAYTAGSVTTELNPKYSHIYSFSTSLCPTVFGIILQLKLCMLYPVWCALLSLSLPLVLHLSVIVCLLLCCLLSGFFFSLIHPPFLCLKDKRLHLIHPCVCPPVPGNDTTTMFLVKPASYGGGTRVSCHA